jgi:hypothetical protein
MKLHSRNVRVNPSTTDKGSSNPRDGVGTTGNISTIAWMAVYNAGTTPDTTKEGTRPSRVALIQ